MSGSMMVVIVVVLVAVGTLVTNIIRSELPFPNTVLLIFVTVFISMVAVPAAIEVMMNVGAAGGTAV